MREKIINLLLAIMIVVSYFPQGNILVKQTEAATSEFSGNLNSDNTFYRPIFPHEWTWYTGDPSRPYGDVTSDYTIVYDSSGLQEQNSYQQTNTGLYNYLTHYIKPSTDGLYTIETTSGPSGDTILFVYEAPFDPNAPLTNLIKANDDKSGSEFTSSVPNITLSSSKNYVIVVTGYGETDTGSVNFSITGVGSVTDSESPISTNQAPTALALSNNTVAENSSSGTTVGTLSTSDPDAGDTFTYSLVSGDTGSFSISGDHLNTNTVFDHETQDSYSVTVRTTDSGGVTFDQAFTISVTDVDEDSPSLTTGTITTSNLTTTEVTLNWTKASDTVTTQTDLEYRVYQSTSNNIDTVSNIDSAVTAGNATVLGSGFAKDINIFNVTGLNPSTQYYFNVVVKDVAGNMSAYSMQSVTTATPNQMPTVPTGIGDFNVGTFSPNDTIDLANHFIDADENDTLLYTVSNNTGSSIVDATILSGTLTLDYLSAGTANITVKADDQKGGTVETMFTVTVKLEISGDGNDDGMITPADSLLIFQSLKTNGIDLTAKQKILLDVNQDNQITSDDAKLIMQMYVGLIDTFPTVEN